MKLKIERRDGEVIKAWGTPDELAPFVRLLSLPRTEDELARARDGLVHRARVHAEQLVGLRPALDDNGPLDDTAGSLPAPPPDLKQRPGRLEKP